MAATNSNGKLNPTPEQITVLVKFWVHKLKNRREPPQVITIDDYLENPVQSHFVNRALDLAMEINLGEFSEETITLFQNTLTKAVFGVHQTGYEIVTRVDYEPCRVLKQSLEGAGIDSNIFNVLPIKTGCAIDLLAGVVYSWQSGKTKVLYKNDLASQQAFVIEAIKPEPFPGNDFLSPISIEEAVANLKANVESAYRRFDKEDVH